MAELHTYMIQSCTMRPGWPLRFSDGERVVAVLESAPALGSDTDMYVMFLVEMPAGYIPPDPEAAAAAAKRA